MTATSPPLLTRTAALLAQAVRDRVFPGCVYAASVEGRVRAHQAVGRFRYEPDSPSVRLDTRYDIASLTKVIAATPAAMLLYDRGLLRLEQSVAELLPQFLAAHPEDQRRRAVTVRMLLDHSSGLPGYGRLFEAATGRNGILELAMQQPLIAHPGVRTEYSDIGFILLSAILEQLAGEPLDRFCQREVFSPLSMHATGYAPPLPMRAAIPPTEIDREFRHRVIQGEVHDENAWAMGGVSGHAGLFADALDCLRFAGCMLNRGSSTAGQRLFEAATVELFATPTCQPADSSRALGWDTPSVPSSSGSRFSARSIGHLGFTGTSLWIDRETRLAVVLLSNRTWPDRGNHAIRALRPRFHDTLRAELGV
jgi:serine-type D-Ala-D-Ala carboxypeptidase